MCHRFIILVLYILVIGQYGRGVDHLRIRKFVLSLCTGKPTTNMVIPTRQSAFSIIRWYEMERVVKTDIFVHSILFTH